MAVREKRNANKIEGWRLSRVPCNPAEDIWQGDMLVWDSGPRQATKAAAAGEANFIGVSDSSNQIMAAGVLMSPFQEPRLNVLQCGLVEMIAGVSETYFPFDGLKIGADAQTVIKGIAPHVGICDPSVGAAGRAVQVGDYVLMWLRVPDAFRAWF